MELLDFEWGRCLDGHIMRGGLIEASSARFETYRPGNDPMLFQVLVDMPATPESALSFTDKFGPLTGTGSSHYTDEGLLISWTNESVANFIEVQAGLRKATELAAAEDWVALVDFFNNYRPSVVGGRLMPRLQHRAHGSVALALVPSTLAQFLALQFALHVASGRKMQRCERCGVPFEVGPGTERRATSRWCGNACRVAAHRARTDAALARAISTER